MEKKNTSLIVLTVILIILIFGLGGYIIYDKVILENNNEINETENNNWNNNIESTQDNKDEAKELFSWSNPNFEIPDLEIKELYDYVKIGAGEIVDVCLKNYYQHPFNKSDIEELIAIVLSVYGNNNRKEIDSAFLNKIPADERETVKYSSYYYVSEDVVINGLKKLYNIDITTSDFSENGYYGAYSYLSSANAFVGLDGGSGYDAKQIEQIISYKKSDSEIEMIVAKAEISFDDNKVYRYVNDLSTFVTTTNGDFRITEDDANNFSQIKYIFKKNTNNQYYIYDIVNLNYQNEYENCE